MRCYQVIIYSLPLTIALCAGTQVSVASAPITELPVPHMYARRPPLKPIVHEVIASWYGRGFAGRLTTSGERFNPHRFTAASTVIPLGSVVRVNNPKNGRSVKVRINDCGPYVRGRSLDLSLGAAQRIGIDQQGVARLTVTPINIPQGADADRCSQ
jgi:rare lipoprotein A